MLWNSLIARIPLSLDADRDDKFVSPAFLCDWMSSEMSTGTVLRAYF
jgi:hypothetical protein